MIGRSDGSDGGQSTKWLDEWIRQRLAAMIDSAGKTYEQLATATNQPYSRIKRLMGGEAQTIDASLACAIAIACDRAPHELYDNSITFAQGRTGVVSVDKMLVAVYNDTSQTGICTLQSWATDDYRVLCTAYNASMPLQDMLVDVEPPFHYGDDAASYKGLTLKNEVKQNEIAAKQTGTTKSLTLVDVDVLHDALLWVQYNVSEFYADRHGPNAQRHLIDLVSLEHPISRYRANGRLKPRIRRRFWKELRSGNYDATQFATDWVGYTRNKNI